MMGCPPVAAQISPSPSSLSSPPLLRLPRPIRQRIYRWLGLASFDNRRYTFNLHAGRQKLRHGRGPLLESRFVPDPSWFYGLLLSCRAIYAEAAALLYSANHFVLYYSDPRSDPGHTPSSLRPLHTLHTLSPLSLRSLSSLKIVLNQAACHHLTTDGDTDSCCVEGREEYRDCFGRERCKGRHDRVHQLPLLSPVSAAGQDDNPASAQAVLDEWHSAAARLLSHVAPGCLALSLVCDIDPQHSGAEEVASSVVARLRLLPRGYLKECNIRLAKTTDRRLQQIAQDTVSHACGIPTPSLTPSSSPARTLMALPRELRIKVLEYSDLVTPSREVTWSRLDRAYVVMSLYYDPSFECWHDRTWGGGPLTNGCFCRRRHAAFSLACQCWAPPGPALFVISRALYEDAQFVFFSSNRFIVHDYKPRPSWALPLLDRLSPDYDELVPRYPYPYERFAVSEFLRDVVPTHSLAHLRFLELVFPPYRPPSWPTTQHLAMQDWWATVDWLRDKINAPGLTLRLMVANLNVSSSPTFYYQTITVEEGGTIMAAYMDLLQPLRQLASDGLARFFVYFPYPWGLTKESKARNLSFTDVGWEAREEEALKERAERYVMGHRYESLYAGGKEEPKPSDWYVLCCSY